MALMNSDISITESLIRMEGKLDRIGDRLTQIDREIERMRTVSHDHANSLTPIIMLNLPERIRVADAKNAEFETRLKTVENTEQQRKGAAKFAGLLWTILGASGAGTVAVILRIMGSI
jgi:sensor histidine kinase regulating citrate/malate metabolism